jgi:hypothetical protein
MYAGVLTAASANRGGGGYGDDPSVSGAGSSGIVVVRYPLEPTDVAYEISSFKFEATNNSSYLGPDATGLISGTSISVNVPYGTDLTSLVATYTTTGASVAVGGVTQTSGSTSNNFSSTKSYVVTAANGATKTYTVTVNTYQATAATGGTISDITVSGKRWRVHSFTTSSNFVVSSLGLYGQAEY